MHSFINVISKVKHQMFWEETKKKKKYRDADEFWFLCFLVSFLIFFLIIFLFFALNIIFVFFCFDLWFWFWFLFLFFILTTIFDSFLAHQREAGNKSDGPSRRVSCPNSFFVFLFNHKSYFHLHVNQLCMFHIFIFN